MQTLYNLVEQPWAYGMHPEKWLKSIAPIMIEEVEEIEKHEIAPHTPWALDDPLGSTQKQNNAHPELWGEYEEDAPKKNPILIIDSSPTETDEEPSWAPPPDLWNVYLNAIEISSEVAPARKQEDREKILEDPKSKSYQRDIKIRYPAPDIPRIAPIKKGQESVPGKPGPAEPVQGNEWLHKQGHYKDGSLLLNASRTNEVKEFRMTKIKAKVVARSTPTFRVNTEVNPSRDHVVIYEYPDHICMRPFYGMVHRITSYSSSSDDVAHGQKMQLKENDTLPDVLNGVITMRNNETFSMIKSLLIQAPLARVEKVRDFMLMRTWREASLQPEQVHVGLSVFYSLPNSNERASASSSVSKVSANISHFYTTPEGAMRVKMESLGRMSAEVALEELSIREEVYKIWPIKHYYRVGLMEPIFNVTKSIPKDYWKRRIKHYAVIMHEITHQNTDQQKRKALDRLCQIFSEIKPTVVKQVYDEFQKAPISINELLKQPDKLTPEDCIAVETSEKWRKHLDSLDMPKQALALPVDKLQALSMEIESFERQRSAIGEVFPMRTPRLKWVIENLQKAPWAEAAAYTSVMESKNLFFKLEPKSQLRFIKTTTQDPMILLEDERTEEEVEEELARHNIKDRALCNKTFAEKLEMLQLREDRAHLDLRRKFETKERTKLAALELSNLYKIRVNEIWRRHLRQLAAPIDKPKAKQNADVYKDFEAELLCDSSSESAEGNSEERAEIEELRKMMGLKEDTPKKEVKKMKQLRVVQIEKDPNGNFVSKEMFIYDDEIQKYYQFCKDHKEGGYIRLSTDDGEDDGTNANPEAPAAKRGSRRIIPKRNNANRPALQVPATPGMAGTSTLTFRRPSHGSRLSLKSGRYGHQRVPQTPLRNSASGSSATTLNFTRNRAANPPSADGKGAPPGAPSGMNNMPPKGDMKGMPPNFKGMPPNMKGIPPNMKGMMAAKGITPEMMGKGMYGMMPPGKGMPPMGPPNGILGGDGSSRTNGPRPDASGAEPDKKKRLTLF